MLVKIIKYELYPKENPIGYAVGFNITTNNNRSFYRDVVISLDQDFEEGTELEIVGLAWNNLKEGILEEVSRLENIPQILGGVWSPDDSTIIGGEIEDQPSIQYHSTVSEMENMILALALDIINIDLQGGI